MKIFVIHRFSDKVSAKLKIDQIKKSLDIKVKFIFLDSNEEWQSKAEKHIYESESCIVYNPDLCYESENAAQEIRLAEQNGKEIIKLNDNMPLSQITEKIKDIYNFTSEFEEKFKGSSNKDILELYKIMIDSSEKLIERRQRTNAFFITVIGALLSIVTLILRNNAFDDRNYLLLVGFSLIVLMVCISWRNLIDNYGKLNKAKFDVILKLEEYMDAQIFSAEWVSLGKGIRKKKYKSFTKAEKNVPLYFGLLIIITFVLIGLVI